MFRFLLPFLAYRLVQGLAGTLRVRISDPHRVGDRPPAPPVIIAFWHNRILITPWFYTTYFSGRRCTAMVSASKDGEILARILSYYRTPCARGSSSRKGVRAFLELLKAVEAGRDPSITPDGPRGPMYEVNPGVVKLAQKTGIEIVPLSFESARCWRLRSWDHFIIPKPFSRVEFRVGAPFRIPAEMDEESACKLFREKLMEITVD
ncbi:MAG: lysophospholipid acyltransferase family protein [Verrucomicrobiae bacterium]|nr:lysophospholipid acyltransferase family protein [Verrucomicrobiae bacterium]